MKGRPVNTKRLGHVGDGCLWIGKEPTRHPHTIGAQLARPPALSSSGPRSSQASVSAFSDQVPLELRQRTEDMKEEPAVRRRGIDALRKAAESHTLGLEALNDLDQVL